MRTLALAWLLVVPCSVAVASPSQKAPAHRPVHVLLVNMSGQQRYVELTSGVLELPIGKLTVVDSRVGFTVTIKSDTQTNVEERILVQEGDDGQLLRVR